MRRLSRVIVGTVIVGAAVSAAACSSSVEPESPPAPVSAVMISNAYGIAASVSAVHDPNARIEYVLHVTNGSDAEEQISYGACWGGVRFYATAARTGTPVFDSEVPGNPCVAILLQQTVAAGGSADLIGYLDVAGLLSAGVAPGHYYASLVVAPNGATTEIAAGEVDIQP